MSRPCGRDTVHMRALLMAAATALVIYMQCGKSCEGLPVVPVHSVALFPLSLP